MDVSISAGAFGKDPRMAWLPMTTRSRLLVRLPPARKTCSSCFRFMGSCLKQIRLGGKTTIDIPSRSWGENAAKRTALPQTSPLFAFIQQNRTHLVPFLVQDNQPFSQGGRRGI